LFALGVIICICQKPKTIGTSARTTVEIFDKDGSIEIEQGKINKNECIEVVWLLAFRNTEKAHPMK
jgi:hypothetical protein